MIRALERVLSSIAAYVRGSARRDEPSIRAGGSDTPVDRLEVASAAQDCLNLLAVMVACADAMRVTHPNKRAGDDDIVEFHKAADRLERVAQQLIEGEPPPYQTRRVIDVNELIRTSEGMLARALPAGVSLWLQLGSVRGLVRAHRWDIERILLNLVALAGRSAPDGTTVFVHTAGFHRVPRSFKASRMRGRSYIRVTVADSRAALRLHSRVVAYFSTWKPVDRSLGVETVSRSVQRLNGALHIESDSGRRMRIRVDIPLVIDSSDDDSTA